MPAMTTTTRLPLWFLLVNWLVVCAAFFLGIALARRTPLPEPQATALHLVHREIVKSYVDEVDPAVLLDRAVAAMAHVDDYSRYVAPSELPRVLEDTTGAYEGIGVLRHYADDGAFVHVPFADGPGDRAGLIPGDRIVAIAGARLETLTERERRGTAASRLRGPAGSRVELAIAREGRPEFTVTLERGPVQKPSVKWARWLDDGAGLGYVHVSDFHPGVVAAFEREVAALAAGPAGLRGLVVDLRGNGGGILDECVAMARLFVPSGNIVTLRRRGSEVVESRDADPRSCRYPDLPLVLLVDEDSASASEVLAGALQDHRRAAVVGVATYGKGFVNTIYEWQDLDFRLKLTTASYFTPNGRNLDRGRHRLENGGDVPAAGHARGGIEPDVEVILDARTRAAVATALADQPLPARHREAFAAWSASRGLRVPGVLPPEDAQLAAALQALRQRVQAAGK
jgi:carboxyl-terminal processing protease